MGARPVSADDHGPACLTLAALGASAVLAFGAGPVGLAAAAAALALLALRIAWQDLTDFTIPDTATLGIGLVGAAWRLAASWEAGDLPLELALLGLDGLLCGGVLLVLREVYYLGRGRDGLGLGDVKLAAAGGLLVGTAGFAWCLFAASLAGILLLLGRRALHRPRHEKNSGFMRGRTRLPLSRLLRRHPPPQRGEGGPRPARTTTAFLP